MQHPRALLAAVAVLLLLLSCTLAGALESSARGPGLPAAVATGQYVVSNARSDGRGGWGATLEYQGTPSKPSLGTPVSPLMLNATLCGQAGTTMRLRVTDPADPGRWTVPGVLALHACDTSHVASAHERGNALIALAPVGAAAWAALLTSDGAVAANVTALQFRDTFLEISVLTSSHGPSGKRGTTASGGGTRVYGLGERVGPLQLPPTTNLTLFTHDQGPPGTSGYPLQNYYGVHPFALLMTPRAGRAEGNAEGASALASGVFLLNSNAMQAETGGGGALSGAGPALTFRSTGGIVDLFAFAGPAPADVVKQYHAVVGLPMLPLYAALGYHQCRDGYRTVERLQQVLAALNGARIPTDWIWSDIDHMDMLQDFTLDPTRFPPSEMAAFTSALHAQGKRYVLILDPAIHINATYGPYVRLLASRAFMRRPESEHSGDDPFVGRLWAGESIFPDVMSDAGVAWWHDEIARFREEVAFDGLWVDENEISQLCNQGNPTWTCEEHPHPPVRRAFAAPQTQQLEFNTPFVPPTHHGVPELSFGTINMTARHAPADGQPQSRSTSTGSGWTTPYKVAAERLSYDTHSMYGVAESAATAAALRSVFPGKRPFVLSRSTFPSSGTHTAHWTGDNQSGWADLLYSIAGTLNFQLFGVPLTGADICGFLGNTTAELCTRWFQAAAFLPFARSHNSAPRDQEPYAFGTATTDAIRAVLQLRYALLPYMYSAFARVAAEGGCVATPMFVAFPDDANTWGIDTQWLLGDALLASPALTQGATSVAAYFPAGARWYDVQTGALVSTEGGGHVSLPTPLSAFNLHVRGGAVVAMQPLPSGVLSTAGARNASLELLVAADSEGAAAGWLYLDDGETDGVGTQYSNATFNASRASAAVWSLAGGTAVHDGYAGASQLRVASVTVSGLSRVKSIAVNGASVPQAQWSKDPGTGLIRVTGLALAVVPSAGHPAWQLSCSMSP